MVRIKLQPGFKATDRFPIPLTSLMTCGSHLFYCGTKRNLGLVVLCLTYGTYFRSDIFRNGFSLPYSRHGCVLEWDGGMNWRIHDHDTFIFLSTILNWLALMPLYEAHMVFSQYQYDAELISTKELTSILHEMLSDLSYSSVNVSKSEPGAASQQKMKAE